MTKNKEPSPDKVYTREEFAKIARSKGWTIINPEVKVDTGGFSRVEKLHSLYLM